MELARNLRVDCVRRLDPPPARHIDVDRTVRDAVEVMRHERIGCLLVCDRDVLVGIFTERDLLVRVLGDGLPLSTPIREVMTPDPITVEANCPIHTALVRMREGGYRHLPVVDESKRPAGVLSVKRVVHYLVEHFPATVYNLPPDPNSVPRQREGA